ncbi:MAG: CvpA family protein [Chitinophagaceae bacterium]|nr:CvpA family protein [Chitinophagaceae bacterium]
MVIDIVLLVVVVMGIIKGIRRGLIVAFFSLIGIIVGLAAAIKLSAWVATKLESTVNISARWLPVISFLIVFIAVVLTIRVIANLIEKTVELAWLGWVNKVGGAILYLLFYVFAMSVFLFFLTQLQLISDKMISESITYQYVQPLGPKVIDGIGRIVPIFKDMFSTLADFFDKLAPKGSQ